MPCNCGGAAPKKPYHVGNAVVDVVTRKAEYVDEETYNKRVATCLNCPGKHYSEVFKACMICKCFVKTKAKFAQSSCPATPKISVDSDGIQTIEEVDAPYWDEVK